MTGETFVSTYVGALTGDERLPVAVVVGMDEPFTPGPDARSANGASGAADAT